MGAQTIKGYAKNIRHIETVRRNDLFNSAMDLAKRHTYIDENLVPRLSEFERLCEKLNCVSGEWAVSREVRGVELSVRHLAAAE